MKAAFQILFVAVLYRINFWAAVGLRVGLLQSV